MGGIVLGLVFIMMAIQLFSAEKRAEDAPSDGEPVVDFGESAEQKLAEAARRAASAHKMSMADAAEKPEDQEAALQKARSRELKEAFEAQDALEAQFVAAEKAQKEKEDEKENPWKKAQEQAAAKRAQEYYAQGDAAMGATLFARVDMARNDAREDDASAGKYDPQAETASFLHRINQIKSQSASQPGRAPGEVAPMDPKLAFHEDAHARNTRSYKRLEEPISPYVIQAGSILPLVLETGISSALPGFVKARFASPVYDSVTGRYLLIPAGTVVTGEYNSTVSFGQERVQVAWTRMILPNGKSMELGGIPAVDLAGQSGVLDQVDNHWDKVLAAAGLSSLFSASAAAAAGPTNQLQTTPQRAALGGFASDITKTGSDVVKKQLNVPPTLSVRPGFQLAAFVREDLVLEPWAHVRGQQ